MSSIVAFLLICSGSSALSYAAFGEPEKEKPKESVPVVEKTPVISATPANTQGGGAVSSGSTPGGTGELKFAGTFNPIKTISNPLLQVVPVTDKGAPITHRIAAGGRPIREWNGGITDATHIMIGDKLAKIDSVGAYNYYIHFESGISQFTTDTQITNITLGKM